MKVITPAHLKFLKDLSDNNNRKWFSENKLRYDTVQKEVKDFFDSVYREMQKSDSLQEFHMHRIYRDLRFSKDKTPYKTHFRLYLGRTKPLLRGGYYLNIAPGQSAVSGGFWKPESKDLLRIRKEIASDSRELQKIFSAKKFVRFFGTIQGEALETNPRGFTGLTEGGDLIRMKQFIARRYFTDAEVTNPNFMAAVISTFKALRPFFDYMSEVLTTDENGESLYQ
ncbi:MAG TPA: DUF2461 domain-containing protein [Ginsengibacter sp.]|nr:DUF2461 domain-containing protein [Ginsengibacter sp.]HRP45813.1 DUF2461 domain-containing protein [Ginsengibacter sp.]